MSPWSISWELPSREVALELDPVAVEVDRPRADRPYVDRSVVAQFEHDRPLADDLLAGIPSDANLADRAVRDRERDVDARCVLAPGEPDAVVGDSHVAHVVLGRVLPPPRDASGIAYSEHYATLTTSLRTLS